MCISARRQNKMMLTPNTSLRTGRGIAIHLDSAFYWYRRAAALGDLNAGWNVGMSYMNGDGVARDTAEGAHWLEMIALREPDAPDTIPGTMMVNGQPQDDPRLAFSPQGQDILQDRIELMQMRLTGQFLSMDSTNAFVWALIANELKAEMPGSDQLQFNDFIEKLELALSPAIVASAKSEAERLLKRPLRHFDARTKLVLDR
jgi:hypothetical protein